jgi:hypothetical protein
MLFIETLEKSLQGNVTAAVETNQGENLAGN